MTKDAKFIWLDKEKYPLLQDSCVSIFSKDRKKYRYGVAAFKKIYEFDKKIKSAEIEVFGDTRFYLWTNSDFVGTGPCPTGGDYEMPYQYSSKYDLDIDKNSIEFYARVQLTPTQQTDNSKCRGGFILSARLMFEDDSEITVSTDETWLARQDREFLAPWCVDFTHQRDEWSNAVAAGSVWNVVSCPIKNLKEEVVNSKKFTAAPNKISKFSVDLDKIYAAYSALKITACGEYRIKLITTEINGISERVHYIKGNKSEEYRSTEYYGVGEYKLIVDNRSDSEVEIVSDVISTYYPSDERGYFRCSDEMLNRIYELGRHTVKICRQGIELDSPVHQENLLCHGDYMIESMVNNYTTGDYSLTRFDLVRASHYLYETDGYMHNDSYVFVWAIWLMEYYIYSGDKSIFKEVLPGMESALARMKGSENEKGLIENVSGYSFVDWAFIDENSMFAPPRALGETFVNAMYYNYIKTAAKVYEILEMTDKARYYTKKAEEFKKTFNGTFFDAEKGLYFDGLNEMSPINMWIPENSEKRYYTRYSNTLAVLFDLCENDSQTEIMEWVLKPENLDGVQPYFMHYIFEALNKFGLFKKYGIDLINKWQVLVDDCEKGMREVWNNYEGYEIDYSHGWGATPTYQLPNKISGIEIIEPGFKKIRLTPNLYGLDWAEIKIPTPYGEICLNLKDRQKPEISVPDGIEVIK